MIFALAFTQLFKFFQVVSARLPDFFITQKNIFCGLPVDNPDCVFILTLLKAKNWELSLAGKEPLSPRLGKSPTLAGI